MSNFGRLGPRLLASLRDAIESLSRNRSHRALFTAFAVLLLLKLAPVGWIANEEEYFQFAHRAVAPEKFDELDASFDRSMGLIVPKIMLGSLVEGLGYDTAHAVARISMAIGYAFALAFLFAAARIALLDAMFVVCAFCLLDEQLVGGEWLFRGVEQKTFAYAAMFIAFGLALKERWRAAMVAGIVATYMHFLIGGFWTAMLLYLHWQDRGIKRPPIGLGASYALCVAPLVGLIVFDQSIGDAHASNGLSADVIYSMVRNPHHVAPFLSFSDFLAWTPGIFATICAAMVLLMVKQQGPLGLLGRAALSGMIFVLIALVVTFFDRDTYYLGKLYLFRPSSLATFFFLCATMLLLSQATERTVNLTRAALAAAVVAWFSFVTLKDQIGEARRDDSLPYASALVEAVEAHSAAGDLVVLEPHRESQVERVRLHREIPRPTLVSWKMIPSNRGEIVRWYELMEARREFFERGCEDGATMTPKPSLIVLFTSAAEARLADCGTIVWRANEVALMKVRADTIDES